MVEFSLALREARVRFPASAKLLILRDNLGMNEAKASKDNEHKLVLIIFRPVCLKLLF